MFPKFVNPLWFGKVAVDAATRQRVMSAAERMKKNAPHVGVRVPSAADVDRMFPKGWNPQAGSWQEQFLGSEWVRDFNTRKAEKEFARTATRPRTYTKPPPGVGFDPFGAGFDPFRNVRHNPVRDLQDMLHHFPNQLKSLGVTAGVLGSAALAYYLYNKSKQGQQKQWI